MRRFTILIITNSASDLSKLDFPEFKIVNTESNEFKEFASKTKIPEYSFSKEKKENFEIREKKRFAIINKDLSQPFGVKKVYDVFHFLLLIFPSNLAVEYIVDFKFKKNDLIHKYSFETKIFNEEDEGFLKYNESNAEKLNEFIKKYSQNYLEIKYLKSSIQNYINAFDNHYYHFSFIALCISLESITNGNTELLYRIRRNVAVICGKDLESSQIIFGNINTIYKLRSKIVHGSDFSDEKVYEYLNYLQSIVSKTIIELIIHNVPSLDLLNKQITTLGFGNRDKISKNWRDIILNENIENTIYKNNVC